MSSIEFRQEKWRLIFKVFDVNGDGILNLDDWRQVGQTFVDSYNLTGGDADKAKEMFADWGGIFYGLAEKGEQEITEGTFVRNLTRLYLNDPGEARRLITKLYQRLWEISDKNCDGYMSQEELIIFNRCFGITEKQCKQIYLYMEAASMGTSGPHGIPITSVVNYCTEIILGGDEQDYKNLDEALKL